MAITREVPRELPVGKSKSIYVLVPQASLSSPGIQGTIGEPRANPGSDCIPQDSGAELTYPV